MYDNFLISIMYVNTCMCRDHYWYGPNKCGADYCRYSTYVLYSPIGITGYGNLDKDLEKCHESYVFRKENKFKGYFRIGVFLILSIFFTKNFAILKFLTQKSTFAKEAENMR
jgi:hypothetical protein